MRIEGKRVLITGASRGLGRTLAFAFADAGAREVIAGTRKEEDRNKLKTDAANVTNSLSTQRRRENARPELI
jgi:NAD(P)-dependent dehydrogenase (short-subunit alcohol dehydrogenase family)